MIFDVYISETMSLKEYTHRRIMLSVRKDMGYLEIEHMSTTSTQQDRLWELSSRSSDLEISVFYTIRNCITQFTRVAAGLYHVEAESIT